MPKDDCSARWYAGGYIAARCPYLFWCVSSELARILLFVSRSHKVRDGTHQACSNKNEEQRDGKTIPVAEEPDRDDNPREEYP